jgi:hypothetical protein
MTQGVAQLGAGELRLLWTREGAAASQGWRYGTGMGAAPSQGWRRHRDGL